MKQITLREYKDKENTLKLIENYEFNELHNDGYEVIHNGVTIAHEQEREIAEDVFKGALNEIF